MAKLGFRVLNSDSICATPPQMPIRAQKGPIGALSEHHMYRSPDDLKQTDIRPRPSGSVKPILKIEITNMCLESLKKRLVGHSVSSNCLIPKGAPSVSSNAY